MDGICCVIPYVLHPMRVALSLFQQGKVRAVNVIVAALLHDTLEDTFTTAQELQELFGESAANTVREVTETDKARQLQKAPSLGANARLVKLADRLDNVRDLLRSKPIAWNDIRAHHYCAHGNKLADVLRGTSPELERELVHAVQLCMRIYSNHKAPPTF